MTRKIVLSQARTRRSRLEVRVACDLTTDVANEPAEPGAQNAQLSAVAIELFGVGITACHHGGASRCGRSTRPPAIACASSSLMKRPASRLLRPRSRALC